MEKSKSLKEIEDIHIYKVVLIPLFTMVLLTVAVYSVFLLSSLSQNKTQIISNLESEILRGSPYFQEEIFLGNYEAVTQRINSINTITGSWDQFNVCLDINLLEISKKSDFVTNNCVKGHIDKIIPIVIGEESYGVFNLYVTRKESLLSYFPKGFLFANLISLLISFILISVLIKRLKNKVILPVQKKIEFDAKKVAEAKVREEVSKKVAHDICSPLAVLKMIVDGDEFKSCEIQTLFEQVYKRLNGIAGSILKKGARIEDFDVVAELINIKDEKRIEHKFQNIQINIEGNIPSVHSWSKHEFTAMVSNMINNSIEANSHNISINAKYCQKKNNLNIGIEDDGKGIPEELSERIGTKGATFDKVDGNGLGLYNAKMFVSRLSGNLEIHSKKNLGTLIEITLPI